MITRFPPSLSRVLILFLSISLSASQGANRVGCQHGRLRPTRNYPQARLDPHGLGGGERVRARSGAVVVSGRLGVGHLRPVPCGGIGGDEVEDGREGGNDWPTSERKLALIMTDTIVGEGRQPSIRYG